MPFASQCSLELHALKLDIRRLNIVRVRRHYMLEIRGKLLSNERGNKSLKVLV